MSNSFAVLAIDDSSDESQGEEDSVQVGKIVNQPHLTAAISNESALSVDPKNDDPKVLDAKAHLLKLLHSALREQVFERNFRRVYGTEDILFLLKDHVVWTNKYLRLVANGIEGDDEGTSIKLWQYKHFGTQVHIVGTSRFGLSGESDEDLAMQSDLIEMHKKDVFRILKHDVERKFGCLAFFADFDAAVKFVKAEAKRLYIKVEFAINEKTKERRAAEWKERQELQAAEWKELCDKYPAQKAPTPVTFGSFLPKFPN